MEITPLPRPEQRYQLEVTRSELLLLRAAAEAASRDDLILLLCRKGFKDEITSMAADVVYENAGGITTMYSALCRALTAEQKADPQ